MHFKHYNSKLLLFGEYTIIRGSQALAIPLPNFHGQWQYNKGQTDERLVKFVAYLQKVKNVDPLFEGIDLDLFREKIAEGLYFDSDIPEGYGAGSSGALSAAVYDRFAPVKSEDILFLKRIFSRIESFFHGSSSGTDPLVTYLNAPILIQETQASIIEMPTLNEQGKGAIFLLDTKIQRETGTLVKVFQERCKEKYYTNRLEAELVPYTDDAIHAFMNGNWSSLIEEVHKIGYFQFKYFEPMIPETLHETWMAGLSGQDYKLKICGAGGGGFMLGFTQDYQRAQQALKGYDLIRIMGF